MTESVYRSDLDAAPDAEFVSGELAHLVVGNRGRLLDVRRTPISVSGLAPGRGAFEVEILAFEDAGARWELPLEDVSRFQFARESSLASRGALAELEDAVSRFNRVLEIDCGPAERQATLREIVAAQRDVRDWLAVPDRDASIDLARQIELRVGAPALFSLLEEFLLARGLAEVEREFSETFVSNPQSGEIVKGHAIVLAELGLCPYRGKIVRDPGIFDTRWSKRLRADHLIARIAFTQELWSSWGLDTATLYRGAAVDGQFPARSPSSFLSATFSRDVAEAHFQGGPQTQTAVLWRQRVPISRLLMTFLETRAMSARFSEAEAVLIGDPGNLAF